MIQARTSTGLWFNEYLTPWDVYAHGFDAILVHQQTPYQEMYIVNSGSFGKALILDGRWQSSVVDEFLYHEPLVHPAMICQGTPRTVLILGGGEGATLREVLRWKTVEKVVMVDIDGDVVEACKTHLPEMHQNAFRDPRAGVVIGDALEYLEQTQQPWDVIISDLSEPVESGPSFALFTQEYFEKIHRVLAPQGCFVMQAGSVSPISVSLFARLARTVASVFPNIQPFSSCPPSFGEPWGFLLASREPISAFPDPQATDQHLTQHLSSDLQMLDGITLLGLFQIPAHLRRAIANEDRIYTLSEPPQILDQSRVKP